MEGGGTGMTNIVIGTGVKQRGAYFTPPGLARVLAEQVIPAGGSPLTVLEPSCGEASLLLASADVATGKGLDVFLHGIEIHPESADNARQIIAEHGLQATIDVADFFSCSPRRFADVVVGNPPYLRFHRHTGEVRESARVAARSAGVEINGLASSWAPFVVHATSMLKTGGNLGLVLPAELLHTSYAAPVRDFLSESFRQVKLILVDDLHFVNAQEEVVLLVAEGFGHETASHLAVARLGNGSGVDLEFSEVPLPENGQRWSGVLSQSIAGEVLAGLESSGGLVPLSSWGTVRLGAVTGANDFFTVDQTEVSKMGFDAEDLVRISPSGSRHLRALDFDDRDWATLVDSGARAYLFRPAEDLSPAAKDKIRAGVQLDINERYKCRVRRPWWRTPLGSVPDLFITYMNQDLPQLAANVAGVHMINSVHGLKVRDGLSDLAMELLPLAALNSATASDGELHGRSYGGGLLKLEPSEAKRWRVPSPDVITEVSGDLRRIKSQVKDLLKQGHFAEAVQRVDDIVLPAIRLDKDSADLLVAEWDTLRTRRQRRQKRQKGLVPHV